MNLIVDVGNTNVKLAVFKGNGIQEKITIKNKYLVSNIKKLINKFPLIDRVVVASVGRLDKSKLKVIESKLKVLYLDQKTKLPFTNSYKSPKTLGVDRIALVCASVQKYPDKNVLIIDAGTCITYDFITSKNEYLGGAISPGMNVRYKSLNNLTENLPLLESKVPISIIGMNTEESIHSGVVNGILLEIEGVIDAYKRNYEDLTVILTGGDSKFLSKQLKSSIFANSNFLLEGLNFILDYNTN